LRFLGSRKVLFNRSGGFDPDAASYFAAAGITNAAERVAANNLIVSLKNNSLWSKFDRLYLFSPTSLAAALYCAKSLTQMTAVNSPTFATTGITFNGTTQYLNTTTNVNTYTQYQQDSASCGVYNRSATPGSGFPVYMGADASLSNAVFRNTGGGTQEFRCNSAIAATFVTATVTGLHCISRESASTIRAFINGSNVVTVGSSTSAARTANPFAIGANIVSGTPGLFSTIEAAFAYISSTMSVAESATLYTAVQAYQTALGRQV
jgi:hypothetical protein